MHAWGNHAADYWAGVAANENQVPIGPEGPAAVIQFYDKWATAIQKRLIYISQQYIVKAIRYEPPVEETLHLKRTNKYKMEQLGHNLLPHGASKKSWCNKCHNLWRNCDLRHIIQGNQQCPGISPWTPRVWDSTHEAVLNIGCTSSITGRTHHPSHHISHLTEIEITFCRRCGRYASSRKMWKLKHPCHTKPENYGAVFRLRRMRLGLHPIPTKE